MIKINKVKKEQEIKEFLIRRNEVKIQEYIKPDKCLEILNRINLLLSKGDLYEARIYTNIEIENLKGITEQTCKNRNEGFLDEYCKKCSNYNCNINKNPKK